MAYGLPMHTHATPINEAYTPLLKILHGRQSTSSCPCEKSNLKRNFNLPNVFPCNIRQKPIVRALKWDFTSNIPLLVGIQHIRSSSTLLVLMGWRRPLKEQQNPYLPIINRSGKQNIPMKKPIIPIHIIWHKASLSRYMVQHHKSILQDCIPTKSSQKRTCILTNCLPLY